MATGSQPEPSPLPEREPFRCETAHEHDCARILPIGELDLATVPILDAEVDGLRNAGFRHVILDLSRLDFMDSTGLRSILDWDAEARRDGFSISLVPGPPAIERVFELTNTREHLLFLDR